MDNSHQITDLLENWNEGDEKVLDVLMPIVEDELRRIAHRFMRKENDNHAWQTTELMNEAYLKLVDQRRTRWQNRGHFFAVSSRIMRRILLNYARDRTADKRGGAFQFVSFEDSETLSEEKSHLLIALDEALTELAVFDRFKSKIVELRFFGGLTIEETAKVLDVSPPTVSLHWRLARSWLQARIENREK